MIEEPEVLFEDEAYRDNQYDTCDCVDVAEDIENVVVDEGHDEIYNNIFLLTKFG